MVFSTSNLLQAESGLLAVTVMGAALASQKLVTVRHIVEFKENLRVLLISALFIILAARLPLRDPDYTNAGSLVFLGALLLVVRPGAVALATWGSKFDWRERLFLGFMAPRGIVAAAVSSLFALELADTRPEAARLVPLTFLVIVGTVGIYGLSAPWVARLLRLAMPNPQGTLLIGATAWVRAMAQVLKEQGIKVVLVDSNWTHVTTARRMGLTTYYGNILAERMVDQLDLEGIGRMLALTSNDEVNALAALHFAEVFDTKHVYQLSPEDDHKGGARESIPRHLRGRFLFGRDVTHDAVAYRFAEGAVIKKNRLTEEFDFDAFRRRYGERAIPLFCIRESGEVAVFTVVNPPTPRPGQILISFVDPQPDGDADG